MMTNTVLLQYVTALADDALVMGQRLSELCSRAPYLEEDLAIANVALDYIGRAKMFYNYAETLGEQSEDELVFFRDERHYTNLLIHELPNGDFAFTLVKQYFLDEFYSLYLEKLRYSEDQTIAAIANKAIKETHYHLKRSKPWIRQLALGTDESLSRLRAAITELEDYVSELFIMPDFEQELLADSIAVDRQTLAEHWLNTVNEFFTSLALDELTLARSIQGGRQGIHTEHLGHMLSEMQFLQRAHPGLNW